MNKRNEIMNHQPNEILNINWFHSWLYDQDSNDTKEKYCFNLSHFFKWKKKELNNKVKPFDYLMTLNQSDFKYLNIIDANTYKNYLKEIHTNEDGRIMKTTINNKISSLSSFCRYLRSKTGNFLIDMNPFEEQLIKGSKSSVKHSEPFTKQEVNLILKELNRRLNNSKNLKNYRNKALILNYLTTGARQKELLQIKYKDINFHNQSFNVLGKGNKFDELKPSQAAWQSLIDYLEFIGYDNVNSNDYIFVGKLGDKKHLTTSTWRTFLSTLLKRLNIKGRSTHSFRSTYCIDLISAGLPINVVKFKMRHSNIATTNDYLVYVDKQKSQLDSTNIMNNLYG